MLLERGFFKPVEKDAKVYISSTFLGEKTAKFIDSYLILKTYIRMCV